MREREREVKELCLRDKYIYISSEGQTDRRPGGRTDGRMNKGTGGQIDRQTKTSDP